MNHTIPSELYTEKIVGKKTFESYHLPERLFGFSHFSHATYDCPWMHIIFRLDRESGTDLTEPSMEEMESGTQLY
eukprot:scaffold33544_cov144-Skeletonema_dohrnii-CCMP3373.AAC.4